MSDDKPYLGLGDFCVDGGQHSSRVTGASIVNQKYIMKILPSSLVFAMTEVDDETAPSFLSVINLGTKPITIYEISVVGDFTITTSFVMGSILLPNGSFDIAVKFTPKRVGAVTGGVYIRATESIGVEFAELTGTGNIADPSIPASLALQTLLESDAGAGHIGSGVFAGTTFPDHSTVKAVLDITEAALENLNDAVLAGAAGPSGGFTRLDVNTTTLTLNTSHANCRLVFQIACIVTVPADLPADFECQWAQMGTGPVSFVSGAGMVINSENDGMSSSGRYALGTLWVDVAGHAVLAGGI